MLVGADETNLHAVWDTNVVAALGQNPDQVASDLAAQIAPEEANSWSRGAPKDWANESFGNAKRTIYSALPGEGGALRRSSCREIMRRANARSPRCSLRGPGCV